MRRKYVKYSPGDYVRVCKPLSCSIWRLGACGVVVSHLVDWEDGDTAYNVRFLEGEETFFASELQRVRRRTDQIVLALALS